MQPGLRLLIDARKLLHGGIGMYIQNLVAGLLEQEIAVRPSITLVGNSAEISRMAWGNEVDVIEDESASYSIDELLFLGRRLQKKVEEKGLQVFHAPHYTLPLGISLPTVVTVHDLIHITHPEKRYYPFIARRLFRAAFDRAERVVAVSRSTAKALQDEFSDVSSLKRKLVVVPNAVDPSYFHPKPSNRAVREKFSIPGDYFLSVLSMLKPHKGWKDLLEAYRLLVERCRAEGRKAPLLVLVGLGTAQQKNIARIRSIFPDTEILHILGKVEQADLVGLTAEAQALIVPSLAEGFSLPVLEAQSLGTPVIVRPVPAIGELLTENDFSTKDFSGEALSNALYAFLTEDLESPWLKPGEQQPGPERMLSYERRNVARILLQMYNELVVGEGGVNPQDSAELQRRISHR